MSLASTTGITEQALLEIQASLKGSPHPEALRRTRQAVAQIRQAHSSRPGVRERLDAIEQWAGTLYSTNQRGPFEVERLSMQILSECLSLRNSLARRSG